MKLFIAEYLKDRIYQILFELSLSEPEEGFKKADKNTNNKVDMKEVVDFFVSFHSRRDYQNANITGAYIVHLAAPPPPTHTHTNRHST